MLQRLGPAITLRLAVMMGGEVGAHSEPGAGSRFWFGAEFGRAPGMATRALRATGCEAPNAAITASAFDDDRRRCEEAGMNGFVAKPFEPGQL